MNRTQDHPTPQDATPADNGGMSHFMESALIRRIETGDEQAIALIYDAYCSVVYSISFSVLNDAKRAEEVLQDTFLQLWRQPSTFATRSTLRSSLAISAYSSAVRTRERLRSA